MSNLSQDEQLAAQFARAAQHAKAAQQNQSPAALQPAIVSPSGAIPPPPPPTDSSPKPKKSKNVFKYFNGCADVYGDPLRIQRDLYLKLGDPDAAFAAVETGEQTGKPDYYAQNVILDNAREAFHMVPLDPQTGCGATDEDVETALGALWSYLEKKSLNSGTKPSSEPSTTLTPTS